MAIDIDFTSVLQAQRNDAALNHVIVASGLVAVALLLAVPFAVETREALSRRVLMPGEELSDLHSIRSDVSLVRGGQSQ